MYNYNKIYIALSSSPTNLKWTEAFRSKKFNHHSAFKYVRNIHHFVLQLCWTHVTDRSTDDSVPIWRVVIWCVNQETLPGARKNRLINLGCCRPNLQPASLLPAVCPLSEAHLELTLWSSQQLRRRVSFYLHALKTNPLHHYHPCEYIRHTGPCPVNNGAAKLMRSDV
jgi:hypothetical protein